ncbi:hypothetical protein ACH5RR_028440 [Cinchona calisaya]|uniref:Uncharacterized protein n=1 Tax=Cinchona calisaya TaxID=153742 RepID=A0ABD2YNT9_9GENT
MSSTCVDPVIHDLKFLQSKLQTGDSIEYGFYDVRDLKHNLQFLKPFLLCVRKLSNNNNHHVYLDFSDFRQNSKPVVLQSFLSSIEYTINESGKSIQSFCRRWESSSSDLEFFVSLVSAVSNFQANIKSLKQKVIKAYITLSGHCSSSQSSSFCLAGDDELVEFIDSILENLVNLLSSQHFEYWEDYNDTLHAKTAALKEKLTFLKIFIAFAKMLCVEPDKLEHLLTHIQFVALNAARLSYMCSFYTQDKEVRDPNMCSMMSELLQKSNPIDLHVYEIYVKVLRGASKSSSASSQTTKMDHKHIVRAFNDSLISSLWELLLCNTSLAVSLKDQMQILYEGLTFLRSILSKPQELMYDELDGKIATVLREAAIVISSLYVNGSDVDDDSPDCCAMLVNINSGITLIKAQVTGSGMIESPAAYRMLDERQEVTRKNSNLMITSKTKIAVSHEFVVELHDEVRKVIDRLVRGSRNLEVIPIVGMPGLGKTTFAKNVYQNPSILNHFHVRHWCSVSQVYNTKNLLLQILCDDGKHSRMNEELKILDEGDLLLKLYQKLKGNKYLIVFDDVWNIGVWNDLCSSFPDDENGSRILFTSRFSNVVSEVEIGKEPHNLRSLTDSESWELLQKKVFGKEDCPQALHEIGMEIAKNCKGLPFTVVIIAGVLATIEHDGLQQVAKSLISTIVYDTDLCKNTLEMSYEHLPHYLKPCLLYFGAFPEDRKIETNKLMRLWVAEGFIQNTEPKRLENVAEEYMMDLIGRNLVTVSKKKFLGGVKACYVHDLLHEFCKSKAKEGHFLQLLQGSDELSIFSEPRNLQRLSIWSMLEEFKKSRIFCPNLISLLFFNQSEVNGWSATAYISPNLHMLVTADISFVFSVYKHLRVLDLEQIKLKHKAFPSEIALLVQLRFFAVWCRSIRFIPPSIANLLDLETFLVTCGYGTVSLPDTIWKMNKLRHLHVTGYSAACSLPIGNSNNLSLLNLDTFSTLDVSSEQNLEEIVRKIPNVRRLEIKFSQTGNKASLNRTLSLDSLSRLESLESLQVFPLDRTLYVEPSHHVKCCFPSSLKELTLRGLRLSGGELSLIQELPNLEVLKLLYCSFEEKGWEMQGGGFPKLRFLRLEDVDIVEWTDDDSGDCLLCLQKLKLIGDLKLQQLPSCLGCIPALEMINVGSVCNDAIRSFVQEIAEEQISNGNENLKILM